MLLRRLCSSNYVIKRPFPKHGSFRYVSQSIAIDRLGMTDSKFAFFPDTVPISLPSSPGYAFRAVYSDLLRATHTENVEQIRTLYPVYAAVMAEHRSGSPMRLSKTGPGTVLVRALHSLIRSGTQEDSAVIGRIAEDMDTLWIPYLKRSATHADLHETVEALGILSKHLAAADLVEEADSHGRLHKIAVGAAWGRLIQSCIENDAADHIPLILERSRRIHAGRSTFAYNAVIQSLLKMDPVPLETVAGYFRDMDEHCVPQTDFSNALRLSWLVREGDMGQARQLVPELQKTAAKISQESPLEASRVILESLAQYAASSGDMKEAWSQVKLVGDLYAFVPDKKTIELMLGSSQPTRDIMQAIQEINLVEDVTGDSADPTPWLMSIHRILASSGGSLQSRTDQALAVLDACTVNKVPLTAALAAPVIRALCATATPNRTDVERAVSIHQRFCAANPVTWELAISRNSAECDIFLSILRSLVSIGDLAQARLLCLDVRHRRLDLRPWRVLPLALSMIRKAKSHEEAFLCYEHIRLTLQPGPRRGHKMRFVDYHSIFETFITMEYPSSLFPPSRLVTAIQEHAEQDGTTSDWRLGLLSLLRKYQIVIKAWVRRFLPEEPHRMEQLRHSMALHVDVIHEKLGSDNDKGSIGLELCNAVMATYSYCFSVKAFKVWDELRTRRYGYTINGISVIIIIDHCGWAARTGRAIAIWNELQAEQYPLNKDHWDAYVECLTKDPATRQMAADIVFSKMGSRGSKDGRVPAANLKTLLILIKQVAHYQDPILMEEIRRRARQHLPLLYSQLGSLTKPVPNHQ